MKKSHPVKRYIYQFPRQEKKYSNRDEFLRYSSISIEVKSDCINEIERICELVARTNQLNYTKLRSDEEQLKALLDNRAMECAYISCKDRFGNHGIIGFYCYDKINNSLIHFLFSCRILGMGVEQYVYSLLNEPSIDIKGEVSVELKSGAEINYIRCVKDGRIISEGIISDGMSKIASDGDTFNTSTVLLKGPCDLATMDSFIAAASIKKEFNYVNDAGVVTAGHNHTMHIIESITMNENELQRLIFDAKIVCRVEGYLVHWCLNSYICISGPS